MGPLDAVKRGRGCVAAVAVVAVVAACGGCAATPDRPAVVPYLVGVAYNLELLEALDLPTPASVMREDLAHVRKLGFDTVLVRHGEEAAMASAVATAGQVGLRVAGSRRNELYYLRTGRLPEGCQSAAALVGDSPRRGQPDLVVLGDVVDAASARRARELAGAYAARSKPPATLALLARPSVQPAAVRPEVTLVACPAGAGTREAKGAAMLLECVQLADEELPQAAARWLRQYHEGLATGLTGGLIVEGFRVVPGRWRGLVEGQERLAMDRATALRRITTRARHWGPLLRRLTPADVRPLGPVSDTLNVVLFSGAKRRFVMLLNSSDTRFIRGVVDLPSELDSKPVNRAVLVPPDPHEIAGQVVQPRTQRLSLPMNLRPGDAALWELF